VQEAKLMAGRLDVNLHMKTAKAGFLRVIPRSGHKQKNPPASPRMGF